MNEKLSAVLLVFLWASGCHGVADKNAQAVKAVIVRYNHLLAEGYLTMNMNPLQEAATAGQATREYHHMAALGEAQVRMEAALQSIEFSRVRFSGSNAASVVTKEVWNFTHLDMKTRRPIYVQKSVVYTLKYQLKKSGRAWYVAAVESIDATSAQ